MSGQQKQTTDTIQSNKSRRRNRLRRLAVANDESADSTCRKLKRYVIGALLIIAAFVVFLGHHKAQNKAKALRTFLSNYRKQYNEIVSGQKNYCDQPLDERLLLGHIREQQILHQEQALHRLQLALHRERSFVGIAFVGPPGVGKSLVARTFAQKFPWQENLHSYNWNTVVPHFSDKVAVVQMIANQLSDCGLNLLIVDNLTPNDVDVVSWLNEILIPVTRNVEAPKKLIVLYVFSLNTFEKADQYKQHQLDLQHLPNVTTINFQPFGPAELRDCVRRDAALENMKLSADDIEEVVSSIDATRSGCKNVHAKLLVVYGLSLYCNRER